MQLSMSPVTTEGYRDWHFEPCLKVTGYGWLVAPGWQSRPRSTGSGQNILNLAGQLISESPVGRVRPYKWELA